MRMIVLLLSLLFATAIMSGHAAAADKEVAEDCRDDQGKDRCARQMQKKMRERYGIEDVDSLMKAGVTLRRAMYVDGYGRDVIAISFVRKPGVSPYVEIRSPCSGEVECPPPLSTPVSSKMWERVIGQSRQFEQRLASEVAAVPTGKDAPIMLCLHSWVVVAEAVDAPEIDQSVSPQEATKGEIRRDTEDSCTRGLAVPFAFQMAELALESLPECGGLDPDRFRNIPMLLSTCNQLRGDRLAAADAYALAVELRNIDSDEQAEIWKFFTSEGRARSADFSRDINKGQLYLSAPVATDANNATVKGEVAFHDSDSDTTTSAPIELRLEREYGDFKIVSYSIGERKPIPD